MDNESSKASENVKDTRYLEDEFITLDKLLADFKKEDVLILVTY